MFGLACKGLHCAGCGKGIPASLFVLVVGILLASSHSFNNALGHAIELAVIVLGIAATVVSIATAAIIALFMRKGPKVVFVRTNRLLFSEIKYLEDGDSEWLALTNGKRPEIVPIIRGTAEVVKDERRRLPR